MKTALVVALTWLVSGCELPVHRNDRGDNLKTPIVKGSTVPSKQGPPPPEFSAKRYTWRGKPRDWRFIWELEERTPEQKADDRETMRMVWKVVGVVAVASAVMFATMKTEKRQYSGGGGGAFCPPTTNGSLFCDWPYQP